MRKFADKESNLTIKVIRTKYRQDKQEALSCLKPTLCIQLCLQYQLTLFCRFVGWLVCGIVVSVAAVWSLTLLVVIWRWGFVDVISDGRNCTARCFCVRTAKGMG